MTEPETPVLLERVADSVPVGPAPVAELLRAGRRAKRRREAGAALAVAAGVAIVVGGSLTVVELSGSDGGTTPVVADAPTTSEPTPTPEGEATADSAGAPAPSGPLTLMMAEDCVEQYSPAATHERGFAFDGVVVAIGPRVTDRPGPPDPRDIFVGVTFEVREWFHGGTGTTVTVDLPPPMSVTPDGSWHGYDVGTRLLVSGDSRWGGAPLDHPVAWTCGFTRYYDEQTAASWR